MKKIKIQCPAKINYTLKITGKRPDGFHEIESIMQTISLFDYLTISIEKSPEFLINLSGDNSEIPYNEKNLVYKAAQLFFENFENKNYKIDIFIEKHIPVAAGLAGGSTDAAGTLYGLNKLLGEPYNEVLLNELCAKLGSDLNVCLWGGKLLATGRGEKTQKLPYEQKSISLIKPLNLGISAKEAYTKFAQKINTDYAAKRVDFVNDLEWAIIDDYSELKFIKQSYPNSIMSGSGSTYYLINEDFSETENYWVKNDIKTTEYGVSEVF